MGFSPLADMRHRIPDGGRSSPRVSGVTGLGLHHNAGVDAFGEASNPGREVSANYWVTNAGVIIPNVDEVRRAWTSGAAGYPAGAAADHRNITVEISNSPEGVRDRTWAISDAAARALIALIADVYKRYGLGPVVRSAHRGVGVHSDWVQTACPGPYINSRLSGWLAQAEDIRAGNQGVSPEIEDDMSYIFIQGKAGVRRGGLYAVVGRQAVFLGNLPVPAGVPVVSDDTAVKGLQALISGL